MNLRNNALLSPLRVNQTSVGSLGTTVKQTHNLTIY